MDFTDCDRPVAQKRRVGSAHRNDLIRCIRNDWTLHLKYIFYPSIQNDEVGGKYVRLEDLGTRYYPAAPPPEVNVDQIDKETGATPLIFAVIKPDTKENRSIARILLRLGAKIGHRDLHGMTALDHACRRGHVLAAKTLLDEAKVTTKDIFINGDRRGRTPIFHVSQQRCCAFKLCKSSN